MTLTEFLLARIAEDEALARRCAGMRAADPEVGADTYGLVITDSGGSGETIIAADPARVLAECEAKRRIVEAFEEERVRRDIYNRAYDEGQLTTDDDLRSRLASNAKCRGLEIAMEAHAAVCADHPDFREEWRL